MATMEELGVMNKPEHIYNVQEEGCKLCLHQQLLVLTQKSLKSIKYVDPEEE